MERRMLQSGRSYMERHVRTDAFEYRSPFPRHITHIGQVGAPATSVRFRGAHRLLCTCGLHHQSRWLTNFCAGQCWTMDSVLTVHSRRDQTPDFVRKH
eukprot:8098428-Pyramimonas_sp.AAC.1